MQFYRLKPESEELLSLDALRFIAAAGVMVVHAAGRSSTLAGYDLWPLGLFVDLFFVISGVVIAHVYGHRLGAAGQYRDFMVRRVARIGPLHWATLAAWIAIGGAIWLTGAQTDNPELFKPSCILPNALMVHALGTCPHLSFNGPSWSISAEMAMYALTPAVLLVARPAAGWLVLALLFAGYWIVDPEWYAWKSQGGALRALPSFLLGVMLHHRRHVLARLAFGPAIIAGSLAGFAVAFAVGAPAFVLLGLLYLAVVGGLAADARGETPAILRAVAPLGLLTYAVYMLHDLFLTVAISFLAHRVIGLEGIALDAAILATCVLVLAASYVSYIWFETPTRRAIIALAKRGERIGVG